MRLVSLRFRPVRACLSRAAVALGTLTVLVSIDAQVSINTIGGGRLSPEGPDAGFLDGNILEASQFRSPFGCAADAVGNLYIADRGNGAVRKLDIEANRVVTLVADLNEPVAVAVGSEGDLYVATYGDGFIWRLDRFDTLIPIAGALNRPTALACDAGRDRLYVVEESGRLGRIDLSTGGFTPLLSGLAAPQGVALLQSGLLAVSESGTHQLRVIDADSGTTIRRIGSGVAGFRNGPASTAQFNRPHKLAAAPDGSLLVADRNNHRIRRVATDGMVGSLYGVDPTQWEGPACPTCDPAILPGWLDGPSTFAEAREPVGVCISEAGVVYVTEAYYHIIRQVTGAGLDGGTGGDGADVVVKAPTISPEAGYFPMGQTIRVTNPNQSDFFESTLFYTTDGTEPTRESRRVPVVNGVGLIEWREPLRDLSSLRVRAFLGPHASPVVSGRRVARTEIGFTGDAVGGVGSTLILPVVINVSSNVMLRTVNFVVEVAPETPGGPAVSEGFQALSVMPDDFIPVAAGAGTGGVARGNLVENGSGNVRRLGVGFISTNSNFELEEFGVPAQIAVPIPEGAVEGQAYRIEVKHASATSDDNRPVSIAPMPPRKIVVRNVPYLVGDTAPAGWYNAGDFGDGDIQIADVNNVFDASLGLKVPFPFSDLFDAMDVYPEDSPGVAGGDGQIRFLDWQLVWLRALRFETENWVRQRTVTGRLTARPAELTENPGLALTPAENVTHSEEPVWFRQALIGAQSRGYVGDNMMVSVPIYLNVLPGFAVSGLQFRVVIEGKLSLKSPARFVPAAGIPELSLVPSSLPYNEVAGAWALHTFDPPLEGRRELGFIEFRVPLGALIGDRYRVRFLTADGASADFSQYDFESVSADVAVGSAAPPTLGPIPISDEWKTHFFGSLDSAAAQPLEDGDGDGLPNWAEYLAGTDPTQWLSRLRLHLSFTEDRGRKESIVRWQTVPGREYVIEASDDLAAPWETLGTFRGDGLPREFRESGEGSDPSRFYRIQIQP